MRGNGGSASRLNRRNRLRGVALQVIIEHLEFRRLYSMGAVPVGGTFTVAGDSIAAHSGVGSQAVATDGRGDAVVAWEVDGASGDLGLIAQHYSAAGPQG